MPEKFIEKLLEIAPQLGLLVLFIFALWILLKEYRSLRSEIKEHVDEAVNSKLGALIGDLQLESSRASDILDEIKKKYETTTNLAAEFESSFNEKKLQFNEMFEQILEKVNKLSISLPKQDMKYSARHLAVLAQQASSLGEAISIIEAAKNDDEATSTDLEVCGDTARKFNKYKLAKEMYQRAVKADPENVSAKIELFSLMAETEPENRDEAIREAINLVVSTMDPMALSRLSNVFIELKRYAELESLCKRILEDETTENEEIKKRAMRNLAVAEKEQGRIQQALKHFKDAYEKYGTDENLVKAYIGLLRQIGNYEEALKLAKELIMLDPIDPIYYRILARAYDDVGDIDQAITWLEKSDYLYGEGPEKELYHKELRKMKAKKELQDLI